MPRHDEISREVQGPAGRARTVSPAPRDVWRRVIETDPYVLATQTPEWTDAMVDVGGWVDASRWYETWEGRDIVLPMVHRRLGGSHGPHSSFSAGYGIGGLVAMDSVISSDVELALADLALQSSVRTTIRINPLLDQTWRKAQAPEGLIVKPRHAHVLDLEGGVDEVWHTKLLSRARRGVRRARKLGVEVECDTDGHLVPVFYEMLMQSIDRWAARQHEPKRLARIRGIKRDPRRKFEIIADRLGDGFRLYVARHEGRPAAAVMVFTGTNAHYTRGAMDADVGGKTNANDLLHWMAIGDACVSGCRSYHMGESRPGSSLAQYKEKFGAQLVPYGEYIIERLPITATDGALRKVVKRAIRFRDV